MSCTSARACIAVGVYSTKIGQVPLAERWNGVRWTIQPTPIPAGYASARLQDVSCASALACTAVGSFFARKGGQRTLAERWNGTRWSIQSTPNRAAGGELSGVSCASFRACIAAGIYFLTNGADLMLTQVWNGSTWKLQPSPALTAYDSGLAQVSCTAPRACTAVGFYFGLTGIQLNLAISTSRRQPRSRP